MVAAVQIHYWEYTPNLGNNSNFNSDQSVLIPIFQFVPFKSCVDLQTPGTGEKGSTDKVGHDVYMAQKIEREKLKSTLTIASMLIYSL